MRNASLAGVLCVLVLGLAVPAAPAPEKADKPKDLIVGKWLPDGDKDKPIIEFTKDGKVTVSGTQGDKKFEAKGTYTFAKGKDNVVEVEIDKTKDTLTVTVTKDQLTTVDSKGKKETFKRVK